MLGSQLQLFQQKPQPQPGPQISESQVKARRLRSELQSFCGTEGYHLFNILFPDVVLTDGAKYLADEAGAYWLMDVIGSVLTTDRKRYIRAGFTTWTLQVTDDNHGTVTCDNGNGRVYYTQEISYTDFPLDEITLYVGLSSGRSHDETIFVILLPSEN